MRLSPLRVGPARRLPAWLAATLALAPVGAAGQRPGASRAVHSPADTARGAAAEFVGWGFALTAGPELAVRRRALNMPDFEVYDVVRRADSAAADAPVLLGIYAGDHPQFTGAGLPPSRVAGLSARDRRVVDGAGRGTRDVLLELPRGTETPPLTPSVLHAWYIALPPAEAARADGLLARLRPTAGAR